MWHTGPYTFDSCACEAAVHAGVIMYDGGGLFKKLVNETNTTKISLETKQTQAKFLFFPKKIYTECCCCQLLEEKLVLKKPVFKYSGFGYFCLLCTFIALVSLILLSIEQHHNSQFQQPYDLEPTIRYNGGWPFVNNAIRMASIVIGICSAACLATRVPSTDGFFQQSFLMFCAGALSLACFILDERLIFYAQAMAECQASNLRYICKFQRFYAIAVMECLSGIFAIAFAGWVLKNVINKVYKQDEDENCPSYSPETKTKQLRISMFVASMYAVVVALEITQWSDNKIVIAGVEKEYPQENFNAYIPRDMFSVSNMEDFKKGGWPNLNYYLRLGPSLGAAVLLSVFILIMDQGGLQAYHHILGIGNVIFGIVLLIAFAYDADQIVYHRGKKCQDFLTNYMECRHHRYNAVAVLEFLIGFFLIFWYAYTVRYMVLFNGKVEAFERGDAPTEEEMNKIKSNEPITH